MENKRREQKGTEKKRRTATKREREGREIDR
jgi:hypothetical protein